MIFRFSMIRHLVLFFIFSYLTSSTCFGLVSSINSCRDSHRLNMGLGLGLLINIFKKPKSLFKADEDIELKKGIAKFYDESSAIWLKVWGENMHHGYYSTSPSSQGKIDHKAAQIDMIDRAIDWSFGNEVKSIENMIDIGCGVGGSTRHLSKRFGCTGKGISLSSYQIQLAKSLTSAAGLSDRLDFQVADALNMPFDDDAFDLAWSMESGEHMPDKRRFLAEMVRVTKPGGRVVIATWCHRDLGVDDSQILTAKETRLLQRISTAYYLPAWVPTARYVTLARELGLENIRTEDWSDFVEPFWPAVIRSALNPRNYWGLLRSGPTTLKGALASLWMRRGFKSGLIKFSLITGSLPPCTAVAVGN